MELLNKLVLKRSLCEFSGCNTSLILGLEVVQTPFRRGRSPCLPHVLNLPRSVSRNPRRLVVGDGSQLTSLRRNDSDGLAPLVFAEAKQHLQRKDVPRGTLFLYRKQSFLSRNFCGSRDLVVLPPLCWSTTVHRGTGVSFFGSHCGRFLTYIFATYPAQCIECSASQAARQ